MILVFLRIKTYPLLFYNTYYNNQLSACKLLLMIPKVRLDVSQQNFVYRSSQIWNSLIKHVLSVCNVEESGIIIPGSTANSDLSASVAFIKKKLRAKLQANQKLVVSLSGSASIL